MCVLLFFCAILLLSYYAFIILFCRAATKARLLFTITDRGRTGQAARSAVRVQSRPDFVYDLSDFHKTDEKVVR